MKSLQQAINDVLEKQWPLKVCAEVIDEKLRSQGIKLPKRQLNELARQILEGNVESINTGGASEGEQPPIQVYLTEEDGRKAEEKLVRLSDSLPEFISEMTMRGVEIMLTSMKRRWPKESRAQKRDMDRFRKNLNARWGLGLERLKMLCTISRELGSGINGALRPQGGGERPQTFDLLIRLHARACQITEEIICLLSNGFADGAMARWRTVHEIAAVACLLDEYGEDLAERYRMHEVVEARKAARQYKRFEAQLSVVPMDDETIEEIEGDYKAAIAKFGAAFSNNYGWAAVALNKENPTIADIQAAAKIHHLSPYYRLASHNVHANPKGVMHKLGLMGGSTVLLAGPSNAGLADPTHSTAISLMVISVILIKLQPTLDNAVTGRVMEESTDEIGALVQEAHDKLEEDEKMIRMSEEDRDSGELSSDSAIIT